MSSLSHLTLLHSDPRVIHALRFGFEREGTKVWCVDSAESLDASLKQGSQLIITGGRSQNEANERLSLAHGVMLGAEKRVRVLYFGNSISREEAMEGGANEFLAQPAFIRDVVTLAKLMATPMERRTQSISGELGEHFGVFYLVRALGAIQYNGVLTLLRGLRRGELRFFAGEVTSAQMGALHGLSALHQALLWTNARFDLRDEEVVRRQQIPMERAELVRDCEGFLEEIRSIAGGLSPSAVLERDPNSDHGALPAQVAEVLSLFDGTGSVADVIEDSPYRIFETLRIACRLADEGFVRRAKKEAPKHLMHTALAIEEWLIGGEVGGPISREDSHPIGPAKGQPASPPKAGGKDKGSSRKRKSKPAPVRQVKSWSDVLPSQQTSADLSQVVPSSAAVGEIVARRPSEMARQGMSDPQMPSPEVTANEAGEAVLSKIFVDASWGATELTGRSAVSDPEVEPDWDEETVRATRQAIVKEATPESESLMPKAGDASDTDAVAMAAKAAAESQAAEEASAAAQLQVEEARAVADAKALAEAKTLAAAQAAEVLQAEAKRNSETEALEAQKAAADAEAKAVAEAKALAEAQAAAEATAAAETRAAEVKAVALAKAEKESQAAKAAQAVASEMQGSSVQIDASASAGYDAGEAKAAHKRVAQTARDGAAAAQAVLNAKILTKGARGKYVRPDPLNERDVNEVGLVAAAASSASSEATMFSADEEAFFNRGLEEAKAPVVALDSFDDLDEGYEVPKTFWQRFMADPDMAKRKRRNKKKS